MNIKSLLSIGLTILLLCSCKPEQPKNTNILFLLVDDMQSDVISSLGNRDIKTPNIDRIIKSGITFINTYTNGALYSTMSMPSRTMLLTGRGIFQIQSDGMTMPESQITLPELLHDNGYRTFATGKWQSDKQSFNRLFAEGDNIFFGDMHPYEENGHCSPHLYHYDKTGKYVNGQFVGKEFSSKMFADAAIDFLKSTKKDKTPFMAYVAFTSPHDPRNQLPEYARKYNPDSISLPYNFLPQHPFDNGELDSREEMLLPAPRSEKQIKEEMARYYGMVSEVDFQIGRILKALEEAGKLKNTIIVFASDNGVAMGQNGLLGKQNLYDHSISVPMTIVAPGYEKEARRTDALCYLHDIYPTICELLGMKIPSSVTGRSLKGIMDGTKDIVRNDVFLVYSNQQRAIVKDDYKFIIYNVNGNITEQLFDLQQDPGEIDNIVSEMPDMRNQLRDLLNLRMRENRDSCDLNKPGWGIDGHKLTREEATSMYIFE